jgi:octaheme c-type cytochrome (tetrathionate reductase family)
MSVIYISRLRQLVLILVYGLGILGIIASGHDGSDDDDAVPDTEIHQAFFKENTYAGTTTCLECHVDTGTEILSTGHWNWQGITVNIEGFESEVHGKRDFINNFCIAVPTNEGRCAQCHIGYGYVDKTFDFQNAENIDCLVCHDQTESYAKAPTAAGNPDPSVDLLAVASSVGMNEGEPQRGNCLACHARAGGGDNVKHGDLSTALKATTREFDVHMGVDGENMSCVACHDVVRTPEGNLLSHGIGGMPYHSVDEGNMKQCTDCHGDRTQIHEGKDVGNLFFSGGGKPRHERLACQVCHIPAIAREIATVVMWDWSTAGLDLPADLDPVTGRPLYDNKKGSFEWGLDVRPELRVHDGKWNKVIVNVNDGFDTVPVNLGSPAADPNDPTATIYPFKKITGKQPADAANKTMLVPHLFGTAGGENPFWVKFDWNLALIDGATYTGQSYSGNHEFVDTEMLLSVNHEIAPAEMALGKGGACADCHTAGLIDWAALGWDQDPHPEKKLRY